MNENSINLIIGIAEIILFTILSILSIYLIISIKKFLNSISKIENEVVEISDQLTPVISDLKYITVDIKDMVDKTRIQFDNIEEISEEFVDKGRGLIESFRKIEEAGSGILSNISGTVSALKKGFSVFGYKIKNG